MIEISSTQDASMLADLNESAQNLHAALHPSIFKKFNHNAMSKAIAQMLTTPDYEAFVARVNGIAAGYMIVFWRHIDESAFHYAYKTLYIDQIAVMDDFKNCGVGSALLAFAEQLAQKANVNRVELDHWSNNERAAVFFKNKGFELIKERRLKTINQW